MNMESIKTRHQTSHTEERSVRPKMLRIQRNHLVEEKEKIIHDCKCKLSNTAIINSDHHE